MVPLLNCSRSDDDSFLRLSLIIIICDVYRYVNGLISNRLSAFILILLTFAFDFVNKEQIINSADQKLAVPFSI